MKLKYLEKPSVIVNKSKNSQHNCITSGCDRVLHLCFTCRKEHLRSEMRIDKARKDSHIHQCQPCSASHSKNFRKENLLQCTLLDYKNNARKRNREFTLTEEQTVELLKSDCHYCGQTPDPLNGIDRMENEIGYTLDNCITACLDCNYRKGQMSYDDFNTWLDKILKFKSH